VKEKPDKQYMIFYDDGKPTQLRIFLGDSDPLVKNKMLIFSKVHFKVPIHLSYERHFERDGKKVVEYYTDDELWMYDETDEEEKNMFKTRVYDSSSDLFGLTKYQISDGYKITLEDWVINEEGTKTEGYIYESN